MLGICLEKLFRAPGQIAVLRALWKSPTPLTGRQLQQLANVHNRTAMRCLEDLEVMGVVRRRAAGRSYLYSLKRSHRAIRDLIGPLFKSEQAVSQRFFEALGKMLEGHCLSAVVYGSAVGSEANPCSDVDLLVVVRDENAATDFSRVRQGKAERLIQKEWAAMLEVNLVTRRGLEKKWDGPLLKRIRREGRLIAGVSLERARRGEAS